MVPHPFLQLLQILFTPYLEARMPTADEPKILRFAKRDVDLLSGGPDIEPCEPVALELRDWARCEAQSGAVKVCG